MMSQDLLCTFYQWELKEEVKLLIAQYNQLLSSHKNRKAVLYCGILYEYGRHNAKKAAGINSFFTDEQVVEYFAALFGYQCEKKDYINMLVKTAEPVINLLSAFRRELLEVYRKYHSMVYHCSATPDLKELTASENKLNQYKNECVEGIFGTSMLVSVFVYILRCAAGGMYGFPEKNTYIFSQNPFRTTFHQTKDLIRNVTVYECPLDLFEPVIDFVPFDFGSLLNPSEASNEFYVKFGDEWICRKRVIKCFKSSYDWRILYSAFADQIRMFYFTDVGRTGNINGNEIDQFVKKNIIRYIS